MLLLNGKYEKKEKLGAGSFGVVYKATYMFKTIALKKIKKTENDSNGIDVTTVREIGWLQEIKHPNIINVSISSAY